MNINNINELEDYFQDNPSSNLFPILSEYYLLNKKIDRAQEICELGLKLNPKSLDGLYVLSRILILKKDFIKSEKTLKKIIKEDPNFFNAYILLSQIYWNQNKTVELKRILNKILLFDSNNTYANEGLKKILILETNHKKTLTKQKKTTNISKINSSVELVNDENINTIPITKDIATFTMVEIFKSQKLYKEALGVLSVMKTKKNSNLKDIKTKQSELTELLKKQNANK
tara:strand:+ start:84093 stop:84779 length:687 start_codon:yes stop_codon:yes gene_type:complete